MLNKNLDFIKNTLEKNKGFNILIVGDSITSAEWVHPNFRDVLEYVLKETLINYSSEIRESWTMPAWGIKFLNCGYDGITSNELLDRLDTHVLKYNPDMTILMVGSNDLDFNISPIESNENILEITRELNKKSSRVFFVSNPLSINKTFNDKYEKYLSAYGDFFKENNVEYVDLFNIMKKFDLTKLYTFKSQGNPDMGLKEGEIDWAHPNMLGNCYIAHVLLKEIFGIRFNPEQYLRELLAGNILPKFNTALVL